MRNALANQLREAKRKGVEQGEYLMSCVTLIALENTINKWDIPVADEFFRDVEKEMNDIRREVLESVPNGEIQEMAERLSYYVDEIRERRGMDAETESENP